MTSYSPSDGDIICILKETLVAPFWNLNECKSDGQHAFSAGSFWFYEYKAVNPKGNNFWIFIGRTDAEAETPILLTTWCEEPTQWEKPDAGKDWEHEKGATEDEMVGWHHRLNGPEFEQTPGDSEG